MRRALSLAARSAQKARRVFQFAPKPFVVCDGILHDEGFDSLRMRQRHPKTYRAAVILHVERIA